MPPSHPSAQDRQVAAAASRMEAEARRELLEQRRAEREGGESVGGEGGGEAGEALIGTLFDAVA